jgi:hypothetical protein
MICMIFNILQCIVSTEKADVETVMVREQLSKPYDKVRTKIMNEQRKRQIIVRRHLNYQ